MASYEELSKFLDDYNPQQQQLGVNSFDGNTPQQLTPYEQMMRDNYGAPEMQAQQQGNAEREGLFNNLINGFTSGAAGVLGGITGIPGQNAASNYFDEVVERNAPIRQHENAFSSLENFGNFLTDPSGAAYTVANQLGSMAALAPAAALVPEGLVGAGAAKVAHVLGKTVGRPAVNWLMTQGGRNALRMGVRGAATAVPESLSEWGSSSKELERQGDPNHMANSFEVFAKNMAMLPVSNGLEYMLLGKNIFHPKGEVGESLLKRIAMSPLRATPEATASAVQNGIEELYQQTASDTAEGKEVGSMLDPESWTASQKDAFEKGAFGSFILGMGSNTAGNLRGINQEQSGETTPNNPAEPPRQFAVEPKIANEVTNSEFGDAVNVAINDQSTNLVDRMRNLQGHITYGAQDGTNCARTIGLALVGTDYQDLINVDNFVEVAQSKGQLKDPANYVPKPGDLAVVNDGNHIVMVSDTGGTIQNGSSHNGVYEDEKSPQQMFGSVKYYISTSELSGNTAGGMAPGQQVEQQPVEETQEQQLEKLHQEAISNIDEVMGKKSPRQIEEEQRIAAEQEAAAQYMAENQSEYEPLVDYRTAFSQQELATLTPQQHVAMQNHLQEVVKNDPSITVTGKWAEMRKYYSELTGNQAVPYAGSNLNAARSQNIQQQQVQAPAVAQQNVVQDQQAQTAVPAQQNVVQNRFAGQQQQNATQPAQQNVTQQPVARQSQPVAPANARNTTTTPTTANTTNSTARTTAPTTTIQPTNGRRVFTEAETNEYKQRLAEINKDREDLVATFQQSGPFVAATATGPVKINNVNEIDYLMQQRKRQAADEIFAKREQPSAAPQNNSQQAQAQPTTPATDQSNSQPAQTQPTAPAGNQAKLQSAEEAFSKEEWDAMSEPQKKKIRGFFRNRQTEKNKSGGYKYAGFVNGSREEQIAAVRARRDRIMQDELNAEAAVSEPGGEEATVAGLEGTPIAPPVAAPQQGEVASEPIPKRWRRGKPVEQKYVDMARRANEGDTKAAENFNKLPKGMQEQALKQLNENTGGNENVTQEPQSAQLQESQTGKSGNQNINTESEQGQQEQSESSEGAENQNEAVVENKTASNIVTKFSDRIDKAESAEKAKTEANEALRLLKAAVTSKQATKEDAKTAADAINERLANKINPNPKTIDGKLKNVMLQRLNSALGRGKVQSLPQNEFYDKLQQAYAESGSDEEARSKVEPFRNGDATVYGFAYNGKIYLNGDVMNANTPAHEFTHVWAKVAQKANSKLWNEGVALLKNDAKELWNEVENDPLYSNIRGNDDAIASEVLARLAGDKNEEYINKLDPNKKYGLMKRIQDWVERVFNEIRSLFDQTSEKPLTYEEFSQMPLKSLWDVGANKQFRKQYDKTMGGNQVEAMARKKAEAEPVDLGQPLSDTWSTRYPTAVGKKGIADTKRMLADYEAIKENPAFFKQLVDKMRVIPGLNVKEKDPNKAAELIIERLKDNILFLHDNVPPEIRERAKKWYDGGNKVVKEWANRYGISDQASAGVIAVLSPQKDWFTNMTLAERILDCVYGHASETWTNAMTLWADGHAENGKKIDPIVSNSEKNQESLKRAKGKTLKELLNSGDYEAAAVWIKCYDKAHNDRGYKVITPEGGMGDYVKSNTGENSGAAWGSFDTIEKAISIAMNPTFENISYQLGIEHKVRNFASNLLHPLSRLYATIDTHAVGVGILTPTSTASQSVLDNFGAAGGNNELGISGTYPIYYEAYRRAAEEVGLLPREMQSITWEAVRNLFPKEMKTKPQEQAEIAEMMQEAEKYIKKGKGSVGVLADQEKYAKMIDKAAVKVKRGASIEGVLASLKKAVKQQPKLVQSIENQEARLAKNKEDLEKGKKSAKPIEPDDVISEIKKKWNGQEKFIAELVAADKRIQAGEDAEAVLKEIKYKGKDQVRIINVFKEADKRINTGKENAKTVLDEARKKVYNISTHGTGNIGKFSWENTHPSSVVGDTYDRSNVKLTKYDEATNGKAYGVSVGLKFDLEKFFSNDENIAKALKELNKEENQEQRQQLEERIQTALDNLAAKVCAEFGTSGQFTPSLQGNNGVTSIGYRIDVATPNATVPLAKMMGYILKQDSVVAISSKPVQGTKPGKVVSVQLPEGWGPKEVAEFSKQLEGIKDKKGRQLISVHSTADGKMTVVNVSNYSTKKLLEKINEVAPDFEASSESMYIAVITKEAGQDGIGPETKDKAQAINRRADYIGAQFAKELKRAVGETGRPELSASVRRVGQRDGSSTGEAEGKSTGRVLGRTQERTGIRRTGNSGVTRQVNFEVAPDPDDKVFSEAWNSKSRERQQEISDKMAPKYAIEVLKMFGVDESALKNQIGGFAGLTNPSFYLDVDADKAIAISKRLGYVMRQNSMMVVSPTKMEGGSENGKIVITLPKGWGQREIAKLYDKLYTITDNHGNPVIGGHSTRDGKMEIVNLSDMDDQELMSEIDKLIPDFKKELSKAYVAFPYKDDYGFAETKEGATDGRIYDEGTNLLRKQFTEELAAELGITEKTGLSGIETRVEQRNGSDVERTKEPGAGRVQSESQEGNESSGGLEAKEAAKLYEKAAENFPEIKDKAVSERVKDGIRQTVDFGKHEGDILESASENRLRQGLSELRASTGPVLHSLGEQAGRNDGGMPLYSEKGFSLTRELINEGYVDLTGRKVNSVSDLAEIAQVLRHPGYEKLHYVYVKDGNVVYHETTSTFLPAVAKAQLKGEKLRQYEARMRENLRKYGADTFYLLHNHPDGDITPSPEDFNLTDFHKKYSAPSGVTFGGHIILDTTKCSVLTDGRTATEHAIPENAQIHYADKADVPHITLGTKLGTSDALIEVSKKLADQSKTTVFFTDTNDKIRSVVQLPDEFTQMDERQMMRYLRWVAKQEYGTWAYIVTSDKDAYNAMLPLYRQGSGVYDILLTGEPATAKGQGEYRYSGRFNAYDFFGIESDASSAHKVLGEGVKTEQNKAGTREGASSMPELQASVAESTIPEVQRSVDELVDEVKKAFPSAKTVQREGQHLIFTMPNGSKIAVDIQNQVALSEEEAAKARKAHGTNNNQPIRVNGYTNTIDKNAAITLAQNGDKGTAFHEAFHTAWNLVMTPKEKAAMLQYFKDKTGSKNVQETMADAYRDWQLARQRHQGTVFGKLFQKIQDFAKKMARILTGTENVHDVMRKVAEGEVWNRESQNTGSRTDYLVTNNKITGDTKVPVIDISGMVRTDSTDAKARAALAETLYGKEFKIIGSEGIGFTKKTEARRVNGKKKLVRPGDHLVRGNGNDMHSPRLVNEVRQKALTAVEDLLDNAVYIEKHPDSAHNTNSRWIDLYAAVRNGDRIYPIHLQAKEKDPGSGEFVVGKAMYYNLTKKEALPPTAKNKLMATETGKASSAISIADLLQNVKDGKGRPYVTDGKLNYDPALSSQPELQAKAGGRQYSISSAADTVLNKAERYVNRNVRQANTSTPEGRTSQIYANTGTKTKAQSIVETLKNYKDKFYREWVDKNHMLHYVDDFIEQTTGKKLSMGESIYYRAQMMRALANGAADTLIQGNEQSMNALRERIGKSVDPKDTARVARAKELKAKFKNVTMKDVLETISNKEMDQKHPDYLKQHGINSWREAFSNYIGARRLLELIRLVEDKSLQNITHSQKEFKEFIDKHPEYEVFRPKSFSGKWREQVQAMAKKEPALAEQMAKELAKQYKLPKGISRADLEATVNNAPKEFNDAAQKFYQLQENLLILMEDGHLIPQAVHEKINSMYKEYCPLVIDYSDTAPLDAQLDGFISRDGAGIANVGSMLNHVLALGSEHGLKSPLESTYNSIQMLTNRAERNKVGVHFVRMVENNPDLAKSGILTKVEGSKAADPKNCVFTVMMNGEKVAYKTTQDMYGPIVGYDDVSAGIIFNTAATAASVLRAGATTSPSFIVRNLIRDTIFAAVSSRNGFVPLLDSYRGFMAYQYNKELRGEFDAMGITSFNFWGNTDNMVKSMDEIMGNAKVTGPISFLKWAFSHVREASDVIEASTRMGEYMKARKAGKSMEEAAFDARDVTLDFSRSGVSGQQYNRIVPFFNAAIQGGDKMIRLATDKKTRAHTWRMLAQYIIFPSLVLWAINHDEPWYEELDPEIKNNYWILPGGKARIPKPQEAGVIFGSGVEAIMDKLAQKDPESMRNWAKAFRDVALPNMIPTIGLPMLEWMTNYSLFREKPIEGNRLKRLPVEQRYNSGTSELSKAIGSAAGLSPVKLDNTARGYLGTMGMLAWQMFDYGFEEKRNLPSRRMNERFFVRDFAINDMNMNRTSEDFYNLVETAQQQHAGYGKKGKPTPAVKAINKAMTNVSKQNKDIQAITNNRHLTPDQKRQLIDRKREMIKTIQKATLKRYRDKFKV